MDLQQIDLKLSVEDFNELLDSDIIERQHEELVEGNHNASMSRAVGFMTKFDCAILTAWREGRNRNDNDARNRDLMDALRNNGYGAIKIRGRYAEVGKPVSSENSFLVFSKTPNSPVFYKLMFSLSQRFEQDCFLFKPAGLSETAYRIGTNDAFGKTKKEIAGLLHINSQHTDAYSRMSSGVITFK